MPRPRRPGAPEPKRRSRKGCWPCKARKVKCGEEKPSCLNCRRQNEPCDYSIRLNWGGRTRRTSSVDSPSSQSSSPSGHYSAFSLSPSNPPQPDPLSPAPRFTPYPIRDGTTTQDRIAGDLLWGAGLAEEMAIGTSTSSPKRLHDFHHESPTAFGQSLNETNRTNGKTSVDMGALSQGQDATTPWPDLSSQIATPSSSETLLAFPSSVSHSLDTVSYPSPADTNSSVGTFATFNFSPATISGPISFLRHTSDLHHSPPECGQVPDHGTDFSSYSSSADMMSVYADFNSHVSAPAHDATSPSSAEVSLLSSGMSQEAPALQAGPTVHTESFFSKIMNGPSASDDQSEGSQSSATCMFAHPDYAARDLSGSVDVSMSERRWRAYLTRVTDNYGLDCGRPDLDLNKNDDHSAIDINYALDLINSDNKSSASTPEDSHTGNTKDSIVDRSKHIYYASPVPINIPRYLSPLPPSLVKTPINLMYFHHFLNHTARMLVPHDCEDNPFVSVLPTMAIGDSNLLNLMLAYSASHRARYLGHPEPATRIAHWVSNVFPALRLALEDPHEKVTDSHLATAIMLLSLKIISPTTFEVPIPWQSHLKLARDLFLARKKQMSFPGNRVGSFLTRWLGYIDLMGTLSCRQSGPPLLAYNSVMSACSDTGLFDEYCVDCFTGFTPRTGVFLTQLGILTHQCDNERFDEAGVFVSDWEPSPDAVFEAEALIADLGDLDTRAYADAAHFQDVGSTNFLAIDRAFRYAGLLHLHRRVLNASPCSQAVKGATNELLRAMVGIRQGASAEVGALFPLFTAGCETRDPQQRAEIQERFEMLERTGMKQMQNARTLMQRCWTEDLPWIALAQGEFLG
ncbi:Zn(II)2Cys6 transcription factor [Aspergillus ibericus CBS 121593]|uniref:C6 zinc finger domain protein n=1 Tax=Aspergillus ibericus CBS 121593 TaxID=1448316 RepID=A0A395H3I0_9EURO|nr:C6 zinc finger domain protein [Aspergillus ibericus CBS 121593]RAL02461.1 C6 zinc finger domain protein [Aspergillus ibericus CBS 121593]